jgi:hypothetical protein
VEEARVTVIRKIFAMRGNLLVEAALPSEKQNGERGRRRAE